MVLRGAVAWLGLAWLGLAWLGSARLGSAWLGLAFGVGKKITQMLRTFKIISIFYTSLTSEKVTGVVPSFSRVGLSLWGLGLALPSFLGFGPSWFGPSFWVLALPSFSGLALPSRGWPFLLGFFFGGFGPSFWRFGFP